MYTHILVTVENSKADEAIIRHIQELAQLHQSRVTIIHVADGFVARNIEQLNLRESEEIKKDRVYVDQQVEHLRQAGIQAEGILAMGDPSAEICRVAEAQHCDLIAMATHGHGFVKDVVLGSVANEVRHRTSIPVLMVRA